MGVIGNGMSILNTGVAAGNIPPPPPSPTSGIVTTGLVVNLDAGNSSSYPGSGTTWTDLTGNGNNGTLVNGVGYSSSNQGSLVFNNTTETSVSLAPSSAFTFGSGDFSVEMWVYVTLTNDHPNYLTINGNSNFYSALRFSYYLGGWGFATSYNGSSWAVQESTPYTPNAWTQVVLSRISGTAYAYINGAFKKSYSLPGTLMASTSTQATTIGNLAYFTNPPNYFNLTGNISITRIYKGYGLTSANVLQNYNVDKSRYGLS